MADTKTVSNLELGIKEAKIITAKNKDGGDITFEGKSGRMFKKVANIAVTLLVAAKDAEKEVRLRGLSILEDDRGSKFLSSRSGFQGQNGTRVNDISIDPSTRDWIISQV